MIWCSMSIFASCAAILESRSVPSSISIVHLAQNHLMLEDAILVKLLYSTDFNFEHGKWTQLLHLSHMMPLSPTSFLHTPQGEGPSSIRNSCGEADGFLVPLSAFWGRQSPMWSPLWLTDETEPFLVLTMVVGQFEYRISVF